MSPPGQLSGQMVAISCPDKSQVSQGLGLLLEALAWGTCWGVGGTHNRKTLAPHSPVSRSVNSNPGSALSYDSVSTFVQWDMITDPSPRTQLSAFHDLRASPHCRRGARGPERDRVCPRPHSKPTEKPRLEENSELVHPAASQGPGLASLAHFIPRPEARRGRS